MTSTQLLTIIESITTQTGLTPADKIAVLQRLVATPVFDPGTVTADWQPQTRAMPPPPAPAPLTDNPW